MGRLERIGEYAVERELGAGGMGAVYAARHLPTGIVRALKIAQLTDPVQATRAQREAEAMAQLDGHPNVVRVHTCGLEQGRLYLVMDLAPGGDLATRLRGGPLEVDDAIRITLALARGLAHVHDRGLLHRDLKPGNVLFAEDDRPLLTDFGLVRGVDRSSLTKTGEVLGTPSYMAPEQADGSQQLDVRTDVYGLGAILYHMLAGRPPFESQGSIVKLFQKLLSEPPAPPSTRNPHVSPALDRVCLRALAKDPAERQPDARSLAAELRQALAPPQRSRALLPALALLAVVSAGSAVAALSRRPSSDAQPSSPAEAATGEPLTATPSATATESPPAQPERSLTLDEFARGLPAVPDDEALVRSLPANLQAAVQMAAGGMSATPARTGAVQWLVGEGRPLEAAAYLHRWVTETNDGDLWHELSKLIGERTFRDQHFNGSLDPKREALRRGIRAGSLGAAVNYADLLLESRRDAVSEALALYRQVRARHQETSHLRTSSALGLAKIAVFWPETPDRPTDAEVCALLDEVWIHADDNARKIDDTRALREIHDARSLQAFIADALPTADDDALFAGLPERERGLVDMLGGSSTWGAKKGVYQWLLDVDRTPDAAAHLAKWAQEGEVEAWTELSKVIARLVSLEELGAHAGMVVECLRLAAEGGSYEGMKRYADQLMSPGRYDPFAAQRWYRPLSTLDVADTPAEGDLDVTDLRIAGRLGLAQVAVDEPGTPERIPDEQARAYLLDVLDRTSPGKDRHRLATRLLAALDAREE